MPRPRGGRDPHAKRGCRPPRSDVATLEHPGPTPDTAKIHADSLRRARSGVTGGHRCLGRRVFPTTAAPELRRQKDRSARWSPSLDFRRSPRPKRLRSPEGAGTASSLLGNEDTLNLRASRACGRPQKCPHPRSEHRDTVNHLTSFGGFQNQGRSGLLGVHEPRVAPL